LLDLKITLSSTIVQDSKLYIVKIHEYPQTVSHADFIQDLNAFENEDFGAGNHRFHTKWFESQRRRSFGLKRFCTSPVRGLIEKTCCGGGCK